jgi:hypothetical protein
MPLGCQSAYADDTGTDHKTPLDLLEQSCDVLMDITKGPTMALSPVQVSVLGIGAVVLLATPNINTPPPANTSALCATRPERCATSSRRTASIWSSARKYRFHERRGGGEGRTHKDRSFPRRGRNVQTGRHLLEDGELDASRRQRWPLGYRSNPHSLGQPRGH